MNFRIIENPYDDYPFDDIIRDYTAKELTVVEIREKYDITSRKWLRDVLPVLKEWGVPLRGHSSTKRTARKFKNYYLTVEGKFRVGKTINNKHYSFGEFKTEEEAEARVNELRENNWDGLI